jgi:hypothetical protein
MRRQPRPRPDLCWLRRVEGLEKRMAEAAEARERVPKVIAIGSTGGTVRRMIEMRRVKADMPTPAAMVVFTSVIEDTSGDTTGWLHDARDVVAVGVESELD